MMTGPLRPHQNVEFGEIAVDQPAAENAHDLADQELVELPCLLS